MNPEDYGYKEIEYVPVAWDEITAVCKSFVEMHKDDLKDITSVIGISRGGVVPASLIARLIGKPLKIVTVGEDFITSVNERHVIVDDIYESGKTLDRIMDMVSEPRKHIYACMYCLESKCLEFMGKTDFVFIGRKKQDGQWLVFPWEVEDENNS